MSGELSVFCRVLQFRHQYYDGYAIFEECKKKEGIKRKTPQLLCIHHKININVKIEEFYFDWLINF